MKKLLAVLSSLLVTVTFATVCLASETLEKKVQEAPLKEKQGKKAPVLKTKKVDGSKDTTQSAAKSEEKKETKDAKKGKKIEKKEEQKKADEKK